MSPVEPISDVVSRVNGEPEIPKVDLEAEEAQ